MRIQRFVARSCFVALIAAIGCGEQDSYASAHITEIRDDCDRTIACKTSRGGTVTDDTKAECVAIGREKLNASSDSQRREFEDVYARCSGEAACAYVQCTGTMQRYSELQATAIRHECTQNINCRLQNGEALGATAIDDCVVQASVALDMSDEATRMGFEARYQRCAQMLVCAYTACP
jgi:hypothetical protein